MTDAIEDGLSHQSPAAGRLGAAFARPKILAAFCVIALAGLGWLALGLLVSGIDAFEAWCHPLTSDPWGAAGLTIVAAMWGAMTLAMMLPSAAPMILTYAEIADTATRKGERIVSPFMLAAGYMTVWLGFAVVTTLAQFVFTRAALLDADMAPASGLFSGALFIAAGVYQFTALKHACLTQCQRPFPFFFSHWATTPRGVFRLGLSQGIYCLGCCWAMMLLMFAVGVMNIIWMAALGIVMTAEKVGAGKRFTHAIGAALIALGVVVAMAGWPHSSI